MPDEYDMKYENISRALRGLEPLYSNDIPDTYCFDDDINDELLVDSEEDDDYMDECTTTQ